jgi:hypothetical protein
MFVSRQGAKLAKESQRRKSRQSRSLQTAKPGKLKFQRVGNEWLGGRDSNPDTQIQSPFGASDSEGNQSLGSANHGEVRQDPQHHRNKDLAESSEAPPAGPMDYETLQPDFEEFLSRLNLFDFEEDTLP